LQTPSCRPPEWASIALGAAAFRHFAETKRKRFSVRSTGEVATCWYVLLSGSVYIDGSMFLPRHRSVSIFLCVFGVATCNFFPCNDRWLALLALIGRLHFGGLPRTPFLDLLLCVVLIGDAAPTKDSIAVGEI
jgi:hypothetical protein